MTNINPSIKTIVFDLGGVLIDWNPRYLYQKIFNDSAEMEYFLTHVCSSEWNLQQDAGRPFQEAVASLLPQHPKYREQIQAYELRWEEMLGDADQGTVELLTECKNSNIEVYALTNWSHEKFPIAQERYPFLSMFKGIIVSGEIKMKKPDLAIYQYLVDQYAIDTSTAVYIDDNLENAEAAAGVGIRGIHFQSAEQLKRELAQLTLASSL